MRDIMPLMSGKRCFFIAEAGVNHNKDMAIAKRLIDEAARIGADAVKFQLFKADLLVAKGTQQADYSKKNTGSDRPYHDLLKSLELGEEEHKELKRYSDTKGIIFLSTPHSTEWSVDVLDKLVLAYKIGSGDLTNLPYLEYVARKGKPVILSTGMANMDEISEAVETVRKINKSIVLLQCTTNYPVDLEKANIKVMERFRKTFNLPVGFSDHTEGIEASLVAVCLGANVIEKHFTLDRDMPGPDHKASSEPDEFERLIRYSRFVETNKITSPIEAFNRINDEFGEGLRIGMVEKILGSDEKIPYPEEIKIALIARKSIVSKKEISKGARITKEDVIIKRPGTGIPPKSLSHVIGKSARKDIGKDEILSWDDLE